MEIVAKKYFSYHCFDILQNIKPNGELYGELLIETPQTFTNRRITKESTIYSIASPDNMCLPVESFDDEGVHL